MIYVGVDSSGPSRAALAWALDRATSAHLPVTLVHVGEPSGPSAAPVLESDATEDAHFVTELADRSRLAHPTIDISTRLVTGSVALQLSIMPKPADLLVLGTHKTGYLRGRSVGTLGMIIANAALSSVAVIPDNGLSQRHGVVVAIAASGWELAVAVGVREALRLSDGVILVHSLPPTRKLAGRDAVAARAAAAQRLMADATAAAHRAAPQVNVTTRVSTRPTLDAILDASWSASLLVIGSRVPDAVTGFVGSTTHDVLTNINSPVLIARGGATLT
jgi:nucleotide-binding universal stress UspA family protein